MLGAVRLVGQGSREAADLDRLVAALPTIKVFVPANRNSRHLCLAFVGASAAISAWFLLKLGEGNPPYPLYFEEDLGTAADVAFGVAFIALAVATAVWFAWMALLPKRSVAHERIRRFLRPFKFTFWPLAYAWGAAEASNWLFRSYTRLSTRGGFVWVGWTNEAYAWLFWTAIFILVAGLLARQWRCTSLWFELGPAGFVPTMFGRARGRGPIRWTDVAGAELVLGPTVAGGPELQSDWFVETTSHGVCSIEWHCLKGALPPEELKSLAARLRELNDVVEAMFPSGGRRTPLARRGAMNRLL